LASEPGEPLRKFCLDKLAFDADVNVTETSEYLTVEPVTLVREGVYPYDDGRALKPGDELAKAAQVSRLYIAWDHPPLRIITRPQEIKGFVDGLHAERDNKGVKVKGRLSFNKKMLTQDQVELIRSKARRDVSLGFYYAEDRTPGSWNGQPYDYVQRDFVFDHVASVDHGRCPFPQCGIGVDANLANVKIGNDPYPNEHSCRIVEPNKFEEHSFRRISRGKVRLILGRLKGQRTMTLQAIRYPTSLWTEAEARANCRTRNGQFEPSSPAQSDTVMEKKKEDMQKYAPRDVNLRVADESGSEKCDHCVFYWYAINACQVVEGQVAANMVCDEFTGRPEIEAVVRAYRAQGGDKQLTYQQEKNLPDSAFAWIGPKGERKLPIPDRDHVVAALQALQGARGGVDIPKADLPKVKRKVCAAAKKYGIKSEYCATADSAADMLRQFRAMAPADLVALHARIHRADDYVPDGLLHRCVLFALTKSR
jgi:hypothetical protein